MATARKIIFKKIDIVSYPIFCIHGSGDVRSQHPEERDGVALMRYLRIECVYAGHPLRQVLSHHIASTQQLPDKTDDIRLEVCIYPLIQKPGDTAWANAIRFKKITIQDFKCLLCFRLLEQGAKTSADVINTSTIIADHEIKIIRVFVFTSLVKSQGF